MDDFKQLKISLFAYWPTCKPAYFRYSESKSEWCQNLPPLLFLSLSFIQ